MPDPARPSAQGSLSPQSSAHRLSRQFNLLRDALQSDKNKVGYFLGAGCPSGIYQQDGTKGEPLIPDVATLTRQIRQILVTSEGEKAPNENLSTALDRIVEACQQGGIDEPNIEHMLTEIRVLRARKGSSVVDGLPKKLLEDLDGRICDLVGDAVGKRLPVHRCSYHRLASWVGGLDRQTPVEVFTSNYDLLVEEAFESQRIPIFDGFVGVREPFFDIPSIEQDIVPRRWTRIWKLHGSINWELGADGSVFRAQGRATAGKAMIYPSHLKYVQARRMPYLAMIDRVRAFFRSGSHSAGLGPPFLVVCGYSFADEHLNEVLMDGLRGNPAAQCFVLSYPKLADCKAVVELATHQPNLTVLAYDGAIIGTRHGLYDSNIAAFVNEEPWWVGDEIAASEHEASRVEIKCRLGDFHYFGLFLESLYGGAFEKENAV